ncbi:MAG: pyridoxamine 5'-phosphate oxidase family protein [Candidatus Kapaibacterium sp.]
MHTPDGENEHINKLGELIKDIRFAMLTTICDDGSLRSRPMTTQEMEFDGDLWFFTSDATPLVGEVKKENHVNVSYADADDNRYVSVSGVGEMVHDRKKIEELWNPAYKAWFPKGLEDPNIALIKVHVENAEYWDSPSSKLVALAGFVKALATGKQYDGGGEHEKLEL